MMLGEELRERGLLQTVEALVAEHGVSVAELGEHNKRPHIVRARRRVWRMLHDLGWSYAAIAWLFGMDHTTVLYALRGRRQQQEVAR